MRAEGGIAIATTRTAHKKAELLALGAHHVIVTEEENLLQRVMEITRNKGVNYVFDPIAGSGVEQLAEATAFGGVIFLYGALANQPTPFPLFTAFHRALSIRGYTLFEVIVNPELRQQAEAYIFKNIEAGILKPKIDKVFRFDELVQAYQYMEANQQIGKIVVTVD